MTSDIVESFLKRKDNLTCHVWESQSVGYWLKAISNLTTFTDNGRLVHLRSSSNDFSSDEIVEKRNEICHSILGLHQSYPDQMRLYWSVYEREDNITQYKIPKVIYNCQYKTNMNYMVWEDDKKWFSEPKPCKDNPTWRDEKEFVGRDGT